MKGEVSRWRDLKRITMLVGEMYKIKIITVLVLAVSLIQVSTQQQNTEDENNQQENNESDEKVREETLAAARRGDIIGFRKGINKGGLKSYVNLYKNYSEQKMKHIENSMNNKMHAIERLIASKLAVPASKNQSEQYHFNVTILPGTDIITQLSLNLEALKNWEYYESPLHNICNLPDVEPRIVKYLLDKDLNTNERSDMNETPLDLAAYNGNLALVKLLIEKGADPKSTVQIDNDHYERMNYHRFIEVISSKDLRVHNGSKIHFSPLVSAIPDGHIDVVKYLISLGADVNVGNQSLTALRSPVIDGNADMVELLLKSGCDVNGKDVMGATALHMAADKGHLKIAKLLLDNGAKITATDNFGWTPLHVAAFSSHNITLLELLLESGASINVKTNGGFTPLILAEAGSNLSFLSCLAPTIASNFTNHTSCQQKSTKSTQSILDLLCKRGANSQQKDETLGWTTLHWASAIGDEKAAKFLVDKCAASVEVRSKAGHSPSDVAKYFGRSTL